MSIFKIGNDEAELDVNYICELLTTNFKDLNAENDPIYGIIVSDIVSIKGGECLSSLSDDLGFRIEYKYKYPNGVVNTLHYENSPDHFNGWLEQRFHTLDPKDKYTYKDWCIVYIKSQYRDGFGIDVYNYIIASIQATKRSNIIQEVLCPKN